jgi:DNA-binding MarR family transcriptional regulator
MTAHDATLRGFLGYGLKRAFNAVQSDVNATLGPLGLRMITFSALAVVRDAPGISAAGLAQVLGLERPNLVLILDELEGAGLITRTRARTDRRTHELRATLVGRKLAARAADALAAHEARMTDGLDAGQRAALRAALARIEDNGRHRE